MFQPSSLFLHSFRYKKEFNADTFVQIHQATGLGKLETLRDDLGVYLKILRSAMIDLINKDYADFVNLSTNLTGLDRLIEALKTPLGQLREEVLTVEQLLSEAIESVSSDLTRRHTINQQKALLHRLNQVSIRLDRLETLLNSKGSGSAAYSTDCSGATNDLVDRIATEVNHLNFLVAQCEGASLLNLFKPRVEAVCNFVEVGLERGLREGIQGADKQLLIRTLRTYASLGTIDHAHQQVRTIIRSHLEEVISDHALKSDPRGLHGMFEKALATVKKVCDPLLAVSLGNGHDVVPGYSFLECSVWPEIVLALETRTSHIFNPGNPSAFHERYKQSMEFLTSFEKLLESEERRETFRNGPDYQNFLELWNLPVYFQIRYQEIGLVMESSLNDNGNGLPLATTNKGFRLAASETVWESLLKCFNSDIFLFPLLHRFWKLCLLIMSRHRTFIIETTKDLKERLKKKDKASASKTSAQSNQWKEEADQDEINNEIKIVIFLLNDIDTLSSRIKTLYSVAIEDQMEHLPEEKRNLIIETLEDQSLKHLETKTELMNLIVEYLTTSMILPLKQVTDTPRIYRRTNKPLPTSHQTYIVNACAPLLSFTSIAKKKIDDTDLQFILKKVFSSVSSQYLNFTFEVLSSVHKMEESLKRLKRARDRGVQGGSNSTNVASDDDKIRSQIYLDVLYLENQIFHFLLVL
ncbi:Conserved oligomeric Golgi complex subunit 2 [Armadillidium vulgare]|nr:Conserved oligomeric Golgi complex subunit 2 [Armadillidium vulgare]